MHRFLVCLFVPALALAAWACSSDSGTAATSTPVTKADIVDVDELTIEGSDAASPIKVGDPAALLGLAKVEGKQSIATVKAVLAHIKDIAKGKDPVRSGKTAAGQDFGVWEAKKGTATVKLVIIRMTEKRLRYLLFAKKDDTSAFKALMTGVFVKWAPNAGAGRFHLSLTNTSDTMPGLDVDGSIHFYFATHKADLKGRRLVYKNVIKRNDKDGVPANFAMDVLHKVGVGGRIRTFAIGDIQTKLDGIELFAMRVLWKNGLGGRADGVLAHVKPLPVAVLAHVHECWDKDGKRTAYKDDVTLNDKDDPDEGDVTKCVELAQEEVPDGSAKPDGTDPDPELDALLNEGEATAIDEAAASEAVDPEAK